MLRVVLSATIVALSLVLILPAPARADDSEKLNALCQEILETIQSYHPVTATEMGIHSYDHRLTDFSSKAVKDVVKKLNSYETKLHKYKKKSLALYDHNTYRLAKANVDILLQDLDKIKWHRRSPQVYAEEAIDGIHSLMQSQHAPLSERVYSIISRMQAVPGFFQTARKNLKKPSPIYIEMATETLESGIDFYQQVAQELMRQFPDRADEILKVSTGAREAMNDFLVYLSEIEPGVDDDFAIGKTNFDYKLSNEYFLPYNSDSLLKIGEELLAEAQSVYDDYVTLLEENHQNGQDSIFVPASFGRQDVLDYYDWEVDQARLFVEAADFVTVPEDIAPLIVAETPSYLRAVTHGITYRPAGPFDAVQQGLFYVRAVPDDLDRAQLEARFRYIHRRGFRSAAVYEGYPGHHLQQQLAARHEDPIRKWQRNPMMSEGWALYCEDMMYESGLYGIDDPSQWLRILDGLRYRAAGIIADVKLHTGQIGYRECIDWMADALNVNTEAGRQYVAAQVRRMTHSPTYEMSGLIGKQEILALREAAMNREGENFSERDFHDTLLSRGSIPPIFMWQILGLDE